MYLKRNIDKCLLEQFKKRAISILIGARQVGESTLLTQLSSQIFKSTRFLNLENPLHLKIFQNGYILVPKYFSSL